MGVQRWLFRPWSAGSGWSQPAARQSWPGGTRVQAGGRGVYGAGGAGGPEPVVAQYACGRVMVWQPEVHRSVVHPGGSGPGAGESGTVCISNTTLAVVVHLFPGYGSSPDVWLGLIGIHGTFWTFAVPACQCGSVGVSRFSHRSPPPGATAAVGHDYTGYWHSTVVECRGRECVGQCWLAHL